jgi:Holliday junction resolvase RusA-like endonuclease
MIVSFWVEGEPRPQPRQRHSIAANNKALKLVRVWKQQIEKAVCHALQRRWPPEKSAATHFAQGTPLAVSVEFRQSRRAVDKHAEAPMRACYGDADNLLKSTWDACTDAGLWNDDAQIVEWEGSRMFADDRGPGAWITVQDIKIWSPSDDEGERL